jgi:hypothetical protein
MLFATGLNSGHGFFGDFGLDYSQILQTGKQVGLDILKSIPGAAGSAVEKVIVEKTTPVAQGIVQAKTQRVIKKGNVALFLVGGATLGALVAGGDWRRRSVGGIIVGTAATLVGWKIGWLEDQG